MIELSLKVDSKDAKNFYNAMLPDFEKKGRSDVEMNLKENILTFNINSNDFTSVRASINGILLKLRAMENISKIK